jgi:hypothetical protein
MSAMTALQGFTLTVTGPKLQELIKRRIAELEPAILAQRAEEEAEEKATRRGMVPMRTLGHRTADQLASHVKCLTLVHDLIDHEASLENVNPRAGGKIYHLTLVDLARLDLVDIVERLPV